MVTQTNVISKAPSQPHLGGMDSGLTSSSPHIFVISDTHFGQKDIIQYFHRPFASVRQMDEHRQKRWNEVVQPQDVVIHCGDFCESKGRDAISKIRKYRQQLNGHVGLILGNHDNRRCNYVGKGGFQFAYLLYKT